MGTVGGPRVIALSSSFPVVLGTTVHCHTTLAGGGTEMAASGSTSSRVAGTLHLKSSAELQVTHVASQD